MPDLGGTPKKRTLDLSGVKTGKAGAASRGASRTANKRAPSEEDGKVTRATARNAGFDPDDDTEDEDEDEIIQASLKDTGGKKIDNRLFIVLAVVAVVIVIALFLILGGRRKDPDPGPTNTATTAPSDPVASASEDVTNPNLGVQDFTQNTNMTNDSPLSDPDGFIQDLYGLTTRVEYEVTAIQNNVVDFVNYTKKRGTWGGGLELYWLDCTYKGNKYVVQVPFQYYKELDDTGIVPVKMEVIYSKQATGETLTVVSYMCLDEATLKTILKSQKK